MNESNTIQFVDLDGEVHSHVVGSLYKATAQTEYHYKRKLPQSEHLEVAKKHSRLVEALEAEKENLEKLKAESKANQKELEAEMGSLIPIISSGLNPEKATVNVFVDKKNRQVFYVKGKLLLGQRNLYPGEDMPLCEEFPVDNADYREEI